MTAVRAVLFDLDGTLADTAPDLGGALNLLLREIGAPEVPLEVARPLTSSGARGMLKAGLGLTPDDERYEPLKQRFLQLYEQNICIDTRLFDGIAELLAALESRNLPWGIVTNKMERFTFPLLGALELDRRAACIVGGDTAPRAKPHPDPLLHAAKQIGLAPEACIYVGDDLRDIQAARAAGMRSVAAAYGYLGEDADVTLWQADAIVSHPLEVLNHVVEHPRVG